MTGSAAVAYLYPRETSFNAFALDMRLGSFRPLMNQGDVADLLRQDRTRSEHDPVWQAYVVENLVEYFVHSRRPTGVISEDDAEWLVAQFSDTPSPTVREVLRGLVSEAESLPPILIGYALSVGAMRL